MKTKRLVVGISGGSCAALGIMLLQTLQGMPEWETHLVISRSGRLTIEHETPFSAEQVESFASVTYAQENIGAAIASGSFRTEGMVVVPCSMKSLAGVACAYSDTLLLRAADVTLKERRRLVLVARETPLNRAHLRNMLEVTEMGGIIFPPVMTMYSAPETIADMVRQTTGKILQLFGIEMPGFVCWQDGTL